MADGHRTGNEFAVVTGATGGIGAEIARELAARGYDVMLVAEAEFDLATPEGVESLYASLSRPVDVLALNAGISQGGEFIAGDLQRHLRLIDLNVRGTVHLAGLVAPDMARRGRGRLLLVSSIAATMPGPFQSTYNASKSFIQSFALALRSELRDHGVSVTVVMPGPTHTNIFARAGQLDTRLGATRHKSDPADVARSAVDALLAGDERVVASGVAVRLATSASRLLPDALKGWINRVATRPGARS